MRKLLLFVLPVLLTACFPFDKIPEVKINFDKASISTIDSLEILNDTYSDHEQENFKVSESIKEYKIYTHGHNVTIRLTLKDKQKIKSNSIKLGESKNQIFISKVDKNYVFEKKEESKILKYGTILLIIFAIIFITKIPIALLIIQPELKRNFILKFSGLNLAYLIVFGILLAIFKAGFSLYLYPGYMVILILDLLFFINFYNERGKIRPIIAGIVSNLLFLTIGQLAITFAMMMTN